MTNNVAANRIIECRTILLLWIVRGLEAEQLFNKALQPVFAFFNGMFNSLIVALFIEQAKTFPAFGQAKEL